MRGADLGYKKIAQSLLWKMLIDKERQKSELQESAGISSASIAKLGKDENITTDVLLKICEALDCDLNDIDKEWIDFIAEKEQSKEKKE